VCQNQPTKDRGTDAIKARSFGGASYCDSHFCPLLQPDLVQNSSPLNNRLVPSLDESVPDGQLPGLEHWQVASAARTIRRAVLAVFIGRPASTIYATPKMLRLNDKMEVPALYLLYATAQHP
jgi:hypothetical protein